MGISNRQNPPGEPDIVARGDQASAEITVVGQIYAALYKSLTDSGVPTSAATRIVCAHIANQKA